MQTNAGYRVYVAIIVHYQGGTVQNSDESKQLRIERCFFNLELATQPEMHELAVGGYRTQRWS